jgi:hypothetical protein
MAAATSGMCLCVLAPLAAQDAGARARISKRFGRLSASSKTVNDPAFASASRDERQARLEPFYRPMMRPEVLKLEVESALEPGELPIFFGRCPSRCSPDPIPT